MQLIFGIGALWGTRTDTPNIGPDQFAVLQDNTVDFSFELKELYSQLGFPIDIARGKGKITGKAKMARVFAALYGDLFFGAAVTANSEDNVSEDEIQTATASVAVTNAATFVQDLGVFYNSGGRKRFAYTTGAPSQGQYAVNAAIGAYTFNSLDNGQSVAISYVFTDTNGKTVTITNNFMGYTPTFKATFYQNRATQGSSGQITLLLNQCISSRLSFPSRIDDYGIPDFDFMALSPGSNIVGTLSTTE
jgi:hypothetical protein